MTTQQEQLDREKRLGLEKVSDIIKEAKRLGMVFLPELKVLTEEDQFNCSLISELPYKKVADVIKETAQAQLDSAKKQIKEGNEEK